MTVAYNVHELVEGLMRIGALRFNFEQPFTYASGLKGPIYCDNRKVLSHPQLRRDFIQAMVALAAPLRHQFDAVAGLATAGIPHAAWLAERLDLPMMYIRSKAKEHGKGQQVEGDPRPGQRLLLVEDLINQASSLDNAVHAAKSCELKPTQVVCLVSYDMTTAVQRLQEWQLPMQAVIHFHHLRQALVAKKSLSPAQLESFDKWHKEPEAWTK